VSGSTGPTDRPVLALSGGVGGAKLVLGLAQVIAPEALHVLANIGDDFEHLGLAICPDIDTLVYTLADLADPQRGWGRRDESWNFMAALAALGGPTWFQLGDADLAMHVERSRRLRDGEPLASITAAICRRLGVRATIWPASDDRLRTHVRTSDGWLAFQEYFVAQRCEPVVEDIAYHGATQAQPRPEALALLRDANLRAVIICPSNPMLSIEPMLAMPALRHALASCAAPRIAVSPIVGGAAIKGPTAKMLRELARPVDALEAARRYAGLIDGYVVDTSDAHVARLDAAGARVIAVPTVMREGASKERLARECLAFADALAARRVDD